MIVGQAQRDLETAYESIEQLLGEKAQLENALQKTVGILFNIRHETDYMPDSYYKWIDKVINEVDDLLPELPDDTQLGNQSTEDGYEFLFGKRD